MKAKIKITDFLIKRGKDAKFLKQWIEIIGLKQIEEISVAIIPKGYKVDILRKDGLRTLLLIPKEAVPREKETS